MFLKLLASAMALAIGVLGSAASVEAAKLKLDPKLLARGKKIFARQCAVCHGISGRGDGEAAYLLFPAPRDYTSKMFKIRTTPQGEPPRRSDIFRTLTLGLPGSTMPSFVSLKEKDRWALVEYVLFLAGFEEEAQEFIKPPKVPPVSEEWLAKGKVAYNKYECWKCHGHNGNGKGPSAPTLKDYRKRPIRPNDYTRGAFKGGGDPQSIITRIMTGMEGTPMPSFTEVATEEDLIALTHYVRKFSGGRDFRQPGTATIPARKLAGKVPTRTEDPRWALVVPTTIPMMQLYNDGRPPVEVKVRAVHDGTRISILLEWGDSTYDTRTLSSRAFADAAAVQFSLHEKNPPLFVMGSRDNLVNIWYWNAALSRKFAGVEARYPGMAVDDYPFSGVVYPPRQMGHPKTASAKVTKRLFIAGWAVGNPTSTPGRARGVMDLNAGGFGTLQPQGPKEQNVTGSGKWKNGVWRVVLNRTLKSSEENDAQLLPGTIHPVAFAVWDGSRRDRDGQKSVTTWYKLRIE